MQKKGRPNLHQEETWGQYFGLIFYRVGRRLRALFIAARLATVKLPSSWERR